MSSGQLTGTVALDSEGDWKLFIEIKRDEGSEAWTVASINFGVLVKAETIPAAKILGMMGKVYVGMGTKCLFDLVHIDKDDVIVSVIYHDTADGKPKVIPLKIEETNAEYFVAFSPTVLGRATIDVRILELLPPLTRLGSLQSISTFY